MTKTFKIVDLPGNKQVQAVALVDSAGNILTPTAMAGGYQTYTNTDPTTIGLPPAGKTFVGTYNNLEWIKDSAGNIVYQTGEDLAQYIAQGSSYIEAVKEKIRTAAGNVYASAAGFLVGSAMYADTWKKANLVLAPVGTKAGTGVGDGKLYSVKGSDFTTARNTTKSRIDVDGYIRQVGLDEVSIDYSSGKAAIKPERQSTNKILYPFSTENSYYTKNGAGIELDPSTAGAELFPNSGFDADITGVTLISGDEVSAISWDSGNAALNLSVTTAGTGMVTPAIQFDLSQALISGNAYKIEFDVVVNSGTPKLYFVYTGGNDSQYRQVLSTGHYTFYLPSYSGVSNFQLKFNGTYLFDINIDNVSIKDVQGFASPFKDTSGNVLNIARKFIEKATTGNHYITVNHTVTDGSDYAKTWIVKPNGRTKIKLISADGDYSTFDIDAGTKTDVSATGTIKELADGYYEISIVNTITGTTDWSRLMLLDASGNDSYTGDGVSGIYLSGTQFEDGDPTSLINDPEDAEGSEVTRIVDNDYVTVPAGVTKITETFEDGTTNVITTIPSTYTLTVDKRYKHVVME